MLSSDFIPSIDLILPFQLDRPNLRGRLGRLGPALSAILRRHDYPYEVAHLLAQTLTLATLLAGMLKYDGIFTLQTKTDGPVRMLVADITSSGAMRAYAQFDEAGIRALGANPSAKKLMGEGYLAFTVDQGDSHERYQGIVELAGESLADFVQHYFKQSEQIDTAIKMEVAYSPATGWQAGGIMLQRLPEERGTIDLASDEEDGWRRSMILLSTASEAELTDPALPPEDLLYRLFHEEEARVYDPQKLEDSCRCSKDRVEGALAALPAEDLAEMAQEGSASVTCEFCSRNYLFSADDLNRLRGLQ